MDMMRLVVLEMMKQVTLTNVLTFIHFRSGQFQGRQRWLGRLNYHVWGDADGLNGAAVRSEVARGGETQGRFVV